MAASLFLFQSLALLLPLGFSPHVVRADPGVDQCLSLGAVSEIANCLDPFIVPENTWTTDAGFAPAQLSSQQLTDYLGVVQYALNATENGVPCTSEASPYTLPESVRCFVAVRQVGDSCVLAESTLFNGTRFDNGLPFIALRSGLTSPRPVHISAAHPRADGQVHLQAAAVFDHSGARSLLSSSRHRAAYAKQGCGKLSDGSPVVPGWVTDAAHHIEEVFHHVALALNAWQQAHGGCPSASCAFIQFHGMADTSCAGDTAFISAGIASATWYANSPAGQRANRFTQNLRTIAAILQRSWTFNTPGTSSCSLTATSNLLARVLNGVQVGQECDHIGTTTLASGSFLSVEQKQSSRDGQWDEALWVRGVRETFTGTCRSGYKLDGNDAACVPVSA